MKTDNNTKGAKVTLLADDVAEIFVALEKVTEELRCHDNDVHGKMIIAESLRIQTYFRRAYYIVAIDNVISKRK